MKLYLWLRSRITPALALVIGALWLALLLFLAIFFADQPAGNFRYGNL